MSRNSDVVRIPPYHYIHVLDQNTNVSRLESGPQVFVRKDNEINLTNVMQYITIPPRHYCTIENPVVKDGVCLALIITYLLRSDFEKYFFDFDQLFLVKMSISKGNYRF